MAIKTYTHMQTFAESALESALEPADSSSELTNSNADTPVGMSWSRTAHNFRSTVRRVG